MLRISGGTYVEICAHPEWNFVYGSGVRAAAALRDQENSIELHTYCDKPNLSQLQLLSATFGFDLKVTPTDTIFSFTYLHGLSRPVVRPNSMAIRRPKAIEVEGEAVLRFGLLEGESVVHAKRAVYDPQAPMDPRPYWENGSTASQLAIVANKYEALALGGATRLTDLDSCLLAELRANLLVVKLGSQGALVITKEGVDRVPAFKTNRVWPIGSGDIFAAVFAHFWAVENKSPTESATLASLGTALYCETRTLPLPRDLSSRLSDRQSTALPCHKSLEDRGKVYIAAPFFTLAQRWLVEEARTHLTFQGVGVFSPLHDVGLGDAFKVVPADLKGLEECNVVLALADGLDPGTIFEIGYARSTDKPVIVFVQNESEENLKMLLGSGCIIVEDFVSAIYQASWAAGEIGQ